MNYLAGIPYQRNLLENQVFLIFFCRGPIFLSPNTSNHHYCKRWWRRQMEFFPRYWPFLWGIHRSPVNSPDKGQWREALIFSLISAWTNGWVNTRDDGDLRRNRSHYDVAAMRLITENTRNQLYVSSTGQFHRYQESLITVKYAYYIFCHEEVICFVCVAMFLTVFSWSLIT